MLEREGQGAAAGGLIGVLGGMGPQATIDFMQKVLRNTRAGVDQEHVPIIVSSVPQIPDRTAAFDGGGTSPLAALVCNGRRLVNAGAQLIVMPCNTAHIWFEELRAELRTPMLHIVDAALNDVIQTCGPRTRVGLLATTATIASKMYVRRSVVRPDTRAITWLSPTSQELGDWIAPAITAVKGGSMDLAADAFEKAAAALVERGADCIVLGCTEIPLALHQSNAAVPLIDATDALARCAIRWSKEKSSRSAVLSPSGEACQS